MAGRLRNLIINSFQDNFIIYLIIPVIFAIGIFFGMMGANNLNDQQAQDLVGYVDGFINNLPTAAVDAPSETKYALILNLKTLFYIWFLGLTVIGIPLTMVITFSRGFVLGFTTGFLIQEKAMQGIWVVLLTVVPQNLILVPVILIAAVTSISFSLFVIRGKFAGRTLNLSKRLLSYTFSFLVLGLFAVLSALIQGYISPSLVKAVFYFTSR
ncbi:stage II sporulation protein M [Dehalobacterium formicoaceticum]|uniref:Stage II sporulation protein M n=1 Tax=Dehalobacterium formicoaceticum TaxID=51515 RepID=A0ABT1Y6T8_9FIRM|nr:stage II sporulation protein M [Dehalobacterium formicoaceticum]MCR6545815.1 stage II sporulation protein M [Dehalobacterium formicoaceticum]